MDRATTLLLALGGAALLYALSRTQAGAQAAGQVVAAGAQAVQGAGAWLMSQIRGIRNNNPGNLVHTADQWEGMSATQTDASFVQFTAPEWGIRAMTRVLRSYFDRGLDTITKMISSWAPPSENDTAAYIAAVSAATGLAPDDQIASFDAIAPQLVDAIIQQENGIQPYPAALIAQGISLEQTA